MNCDETSQYIYVYLDGEANMVRRWWIRRHLRRCPPCEKGLVFEGRLRLRVRESCREELPPELLNRLRMFLQEHADDGE
jgi:mycothiol system anti-sigma-R factor